MDIYGIWLEICSHHRSLQVYVTNIIAYPNSCVIVQAGVCVQKAVGIQIACGVCMLRARLWCTWAQRHAGDHAEVCISRQLSV